MVDYNYKEYGVEVKVEGQIKNTPPRKIVLLYYV